MLGTGVSEAGAAERPRTGVSDGPDSKRRRIWNLFISSAEVGRQAVEYTVSRRRAQPGAPVSSRTSQLIRSAAVPAPRRHLGAPAAQFAYTCKGPWGKRPGQQQWQLPSWEGQRRRFLHSHTGPCSVMTAPRQVGGHGPITPGVNLPGAFDRWER